MPFARQVSIGRVALVQFPEAEAGQLVVISDVVSPNAVSWGGQGPRAAVWVMEARLGLGEPPCPAQPHQHRAWRRQAGGPRRWTSWRRPQRRQAAGGGGRRQHSLQPGPSAALELAGVAAWSEWCSGWTSSAQLMEEEQLWLGVRPLRLLQPLRRRCSHAAAAPLATHCRSSSAGLGITAAAAPPLPCARRRWWTSPARRAA